MAFDPSSITKFSLGSEDYHYGQVYLLDESTWQVALAILDDDGDWPGEYEVTQFSGSLREVLESLDHPIWIESDFTWEEFCEFMKPIWADKKVFDGRFNFYIWEDFGEYVEYPGN
jgi:hypothetical protein